MKIQFACGGNKLDGWLNLDHGDGDITRPLAFKDNSTNFVFIEHGLEHISPKDGYKFLRECYRILKPKGVIRVIVPDVSKIWPNDSSEWALYIEDYRALVKEGMKTWWPAIGWSVRENQIPSNRELVETLIFCHGHKSIFTRDLLEVIMATAGFSVVFSKYGESTHSELSGIDSHWKYMGLENCILESCVVEGTK